MVEQQLYIALLYIVDNVYKELEFSSYHRVPFGKVGWVYHPNVLGICNDEPIVFNKPMDETWDTIYAMALYMSKEGQEGFIGLYPINPIDAGINKDVIIDEDSIFLPLTFMKNVQGTISSHTMH